MNKSYKEKIKFRKRFLFEHCEEDFVCFTTNSNILISIPHAVSQIRLGKLKVAEIGTLPFGYLLAQELGANAIIKTKNNNDDANFDEVSSYRDKIEHLVSAKGIKYLVDIHGMKKSRECDVNLGINFGNNIKSNEKLFTALESELKRAGFSVQIDVPFMAGQRTIAGSFAKRFNIFTLQIEINCGITNESSNNKRANLLLQTITNVFKKVK